MNCRRRSAVDDDRSRRIRLAVDDDRRQRRWAFDDDRSHIAFYQAQVKASLDRVDKTLDRIDKKRMRMPATIPTSSSSLLSEASCKRHYKFAVDDYYPPLELTLRWRYPPPDRTVHNLPVTGIRNSLPLQPHPITHDSTSASSRNLVMPHDKNDDSDSFHSDSGPDTSLSSLLLPVRYGNSKPTPASTQQLQHDLPLPHPQHFTCDSLPEETTANVTSPSLFAPNTVIPVSSFCFPNKSLQPNPHDGIPVAGILSNPTSATQTLSPAQTKIPFDLTHR